jgi:deoxyinosine 3'endonuclease (endonuclease V)
MKYFLDTHYVDNRAVTSCIGINNWQDDKISFETADEIQIESDYISGEFYKRELPCILSILNKVKLEEKDVIVIDGYVYLDDYKKFGLGAYLYENLKQEIPIIGVAKKNFFGLNELKREVIRGRSLKPLYITSVGIDIDYCIQSILGMHGEYRIPTILRLVDQKCRQII